MAQPRSAVPASLLCAICLLGTACEDITAPPPAALHNAVLGEQQRLGWTIDEEFARIAREEVPGFAGYFVDEAGRFTVQLKNPGHRDRAIAALSRAFARQEARGVPGPNVASARILQARYDYIELKHWRDQARHLLGISGVHSLAIDDARNRLQIGIGREADRSGVTAQIAMLGIPSGAAVVEVGERTVAAIDLPLTNSTVSPQSIEPVYNVDGSLAVTTLQDPYPKLIGGLEIWWFDQLDNKYFPCTYGVNAEGSYFFGPQFVTAAHCSQTFGVADATRMFQGDFENQSSIGYEREDPATFSGPSSQGKPCPTGRCRYSDAAASVLQNLSFEFGNIAKTQNSHAYSGSKVITGRFKITAAYEVPYAPPYTGMPLDKMGAVTGWTNGTVSNPCEDVTYDIKGQLHTFFCQTRVSAGAGPGDSGSPVFRRAVNDDVIFYGILTAGTSVSYVFSSYQNILSDRILFTVYPDQ